jgi:phage FluMu protein gp41
MPVHIDEMSSEVTVVEGELPLSPRQIDKLVKLVMSRIAEQAREGERSRAATQLRRQASPPFERGT